VGAILVLPFVITPPANVATFLSNVTLQNTSGSATPTQSFVTFGQAFRKGDLPTGMVPVLVSQSGTAIPAQFDLRNTWPDGSLRWCEVSCMVPSIAGSGLAQAYIYSAFGSFDSAPRRSLADITSNSNIQVAITNCKDSTGTAYNGGSMTAGFNAASVINIEHIKSGPVCDQWKAWMFFPSQQNLLAYFYVTAWTNQSNGTFSTISHITKVHNGCINVAGITKLFYDATYTDGVSTTRVFGAGASEKQFTWTGSSNQITCTAHGLQTGQIVTVRSTGSLPPGDTATFTVASGTTTWTSSSGGYTACTVSSSGTLPAPLVTGKVYYIGGGGNNNLFNFLGDGSVAPITFTTAGTGVHTANFGLLDSVVNPPGLPYYVTVINANTLQLSHSGAGSQFGSDLMVITGTGSGNHFLNPRIVQNHHSSWYATRADGKSDWTSNEATIFVRPDKNYVRYTGLLPPYDLDVLPNPLTPTNPAVNPLGTTFYSPMTLGNLRGDLTNVGTDPTIGVLPQWCAQAFLSGTAAFAQIARANALAQCGWGCWINEATGKIPTFIGPTSNGASGTFTGLGTPFLTLCYGGSKKGTFVQPTGGYGAYDAGERTALEDFSHNPDCIHYTIVTEGGAHLIDSQIVFANMGPLGQDSDTGNYDWYFNSGRRQQILGTDYYGIFVGQIRSVGWQIRTWTHARATIPDSWVEQAYFDSMLKVNATWAVAQITNNLTSAMISTGWWPINQGTQQAHWMHAYIMRSVCHAAYLFSDSNMNTWATHMIKLHSNFAQNWTAIGFCTLSISSNAAPSNFAPGDNRNSWFTIDKVGISYDTNGSGEPNATFDHTTNSVNEFSNHSFLPSYWFPLTAGDRIMMIPPDNGNTYVPPTGLSFGVWYYIYNITGSFPNFNYNISTTYPSITPATFSDNGSSNTGNFEFYRQPSVAPTVLADSNQNAPLFELFGCLATILEYGFSDGGGYSQIFTFLKNNLVWTNSDANRTIQQKPIWGMKPWFVPPGIPINALGIIRYVNTNIALFSGGDGTTTALTGPHAAYPSLGLANRTENSSGPGGLRDLTGTGGITFWCSGSTEDLVNFSTPPYGLIPSGQVIANGRGQVTVTRPQGGGEGFIPTANDQIRFLTNPSVIDGRNFGPSFDLTKYHMAFRGEGVPNVEPNSGQCFYMEIGYVTIDGLQFTVQSIGAVGGHAVKIPASTINPVIVKNCRVSVHADSNGFSTLGFAMYNPTSPGPPFVSANVTIQNNTFQLDSAYGDEQGLELATSTPGDIWNFVNNTISGFPIGIVINSPSTGLVNIINNAIFHKQTGPNTDFQGNIVNNGTGTQVIDHNASDDGTGTNAIHWVNGATDWNNNFVDYTTGKFAEKSGASIIGAGTSSNTSITDIDGTTRKSPPDIGAWERN
jgi:hypothetical protein